MRTEGVTILEPILTLTVTPFVMLGGLYPLCATFAPLTWRFHYLFTLVMCGDHFFL